jgi:hypothetical protein
LLQALHRPRGGQLTRILASLSDPARSAMANQAALWFGTPTNVGPATTVGAVQLELDVHIAT